MERSSKIYLSCCLVIAFSLLAFSKGSTIMMAGVGVFGVGINFYLIMYHSIKYYKEKHL